MKAKLMNSRRPSMLHFSHQWVRAGMRRWLLCWFDEKGDLQAQRVSAKFAKAMIAAGASYDA